MRKFWYLLPCFITLTVLVLFFSSRKSIRTFIKEKIVKRYLNRFYLYFDNIYTFYFKHSTYILINMLLTFCKFVIGSFSIYIAFLGLKVIHPFINIFLIDTCSKLSFYIPISFQGIGLLEWVSIILFKTFNISNENILSAYLINRAGGYSMAIIVFILAIFVFKLNLKNIWKYNIFKNGK